MKLCKYCNIEKNLDLFPIRKSGKDGHRNMCKKCYSSYIKSKGYKYQTKKSKDEISEYNREYNLKNKEIISINKKNYYQKNKSIILDCRKIHRECNKEYYKNYSKTYREDNFEALKIYRREYEINKKKIDPLYNLKSHLRVLIKNNLNNKGYIKESKSQEILGCSFEEFKIYLESKFEDWMTWENRGLYNSELNYGWDIDHIIPLSSAKTEEDLIKLNHYTNLQPLCSYVNRVIKRDKIEYEQ